MSLFPSVAVVVAYGSKGGGYFMFCFLLNWYVYVSLFVNGFFVWF